MSTAGVVPTAGAGVFRDLARPSTPADRRRFRLVATGVAGSGAMLLAAVAILTLTGGDEEVDGISYGDSPIIPGRLTGKVAPFLAQEGLRPGTAFAATVLAIPFLLFAVQALRTGTAARERRLAALSLAGATRGQLRRVAVLEGTRAAGAGALACGPLYLLLYLLLGVALPDRTKLLPPVQLEVVAAWPVVMLLLVAGGAVAAALTARPASVTPLGLARRGSRPLGARAAVLPATTLVVLLFSQLAVGLLPTTRAYMPLSLGSLIVLALTAGPWIVLATGRVLARSPRLVTAMAGRRLVLDPRTPGRVAGVLLVVGVAFGVLGISLAQALRGWSDGTTFGASRAAILGGTGTAAAAVLVAGVVAVCSLVVGATEQVLDGRRGTAVLVALAASPGIVIRVLRRQLLFTALVPAVLGVTLTWSMVRRWSGDFGAAFDVWAWTTFGGALTAAVLTTVLGAVAATRALRPAVAESSRPENLRVP